jgi:MoaA/NifB/PqqE/SkfB family radical SAM enzyme
MSAIPLRSLHIEPTNLCTLKCSGCARTNFIEQWPQHWRNYSLDTQALMTFLDIDLTNMLVLLCGNYGDPIYHPEFIGMVQAFKQRGANVSIITNGSYKKADWWEKLTQHLDENDIVTFSVDGIPENFTQYRVNADWKSIEVAMKVCAQAKCQTVWKFIPFSFNQCDIGQAQELSKQIGIDKFIIVPSDRFDEKSAHLKPADGLVGNKHSEQVAWKIDHVSSGVNAKCSSGNEHFITATGHYSSCCYAADHRFYYKNDFGRDKKAYSIYNTTLTDILNRPSVIKFYDSLDTHAVCQYNCPNVEK